MTRSGIGQPVRRVEDQRFLTGRARYVDDIQLPRMLHGAVVMSPHAHARIVSINTKPALEMPGVHLVLTGQDARSENLGGIAPLFMPNDMGNVAFPLMMGNKEATDAAFARAKHVVAVRLYNNRISANAIEPRAALGDF